MIIEPILYICQFFPCLITVSFSKAYRKQIGTWPKVFGRNYSKSIKTIKEQGEIF